MPDITIKDFRRGLDLRKFRLSLPAGTLIVGNNGHINQGGEFEKRKALIRLANSDGGVATSLPTGTFGWLAISTGHLVFGSQDGSALTFPTGVTYQRLQHPDGATAMTAVIDAKLFGSDAWVIAKFADGNYFEFYNGSQIKDFYSGLVWSGNNTNAQITASLKALIADTDGYTVTGIDSTDFYIFSKPSTFDSTPYTVDKTVESLGGNVGVQNISTGLPSTDAVAPVGQIQITAGGSNTAASGTISNLVAAVSTNPVNGTTLTIGATIYKFVNAFSGNANEILIQATADLTSTALINAINNDAGSGITYSSLTEKNKDVTASVLTAHVFTITAIVGGAIGNSLALTTTSAWTLSGATLAGGDTTGTVGTNQITQIAVGATNLLTGPVQFNQSVSQTASDLSVAINSNSSTSGYTATSTGAVVTISPSLSGSSLNGTAITTTCAGNVCVDNCIMSVSGLTAASVAVASSQTSGTLTVGQLYKISTFVAGDNFTNVGAASNASGIYFVATGTTPTTYTHGSTVQKINGSVISSITINGGSNIMTAPIVYRQTGFTTETAVQYVARIAANINANTGTSGWLSNADSVNPLLTLSKTIRVSSDSSPAVVLTYTSVTISTQDGTTYTIGVTLSVTSLTVKYRSIGSLPATGSTGSVTALATGGLAPYSFKWVFVSNTIQSSPLMGATKPTSATTVFSTLTKNEELKGNWSEVWKCVVTDANNNSSDLATVTIYSNSLG